MSRLQEQYQQKIAQELKKDLELKNLHEVPHLEKVVINVGAGRSLNDSRVLETAKSTLAKITGQRPVATKARKSIAGFKLREGAEIGVKVTLRGKRMYEFIDRLVNVVLPRMRDFRGVSAKAFDGSGNYSLGITDQSIFPELTYDDLNITHGLQVNLIIKSKDQEHSKALLSALGFPFERSSDG